MLTQYGFHTLAQLTQAKVVACDLHQSCAQLRLTFMAVA